MRVKFKTHISEAESIPEEKFRLTFSQQDETRFDCWKRVELVKNNACTTMFNHGAFATKFRSKENQMETPKVYGYYEDVNPYYRVVHLPSGKDMLDFPVMEETQARRIAEALNEAYEQGQKDVS